MQPPNGFTNEVQLLVDWQPHPKKPINPLFRLDGRGRGLGVGGQKHLASNFLSNNCMREALKNTQIVLKFNLLDKLKNKVQENL